MNLDDPILADISLPWRLSAPDDPDEVAEALRASLGISPGPLRLVAQKHIQLYSAWLWANPSGEAFLSKKPKGQPAFVWATNSPVEKVLRRNPSLKLVVLDEKENP